MAAWTWMSRQISTISKPARMLSPKKWVFKVREASLTFVQLEGENVTLVCKASGHPTPRITWKREDRGNIIRNPARWAEQTSNWGFYHLFLTQGQKWNWALRRREFNHIKVKYLMSKITKNYNKTIGSWKMSLSVCRKCCRTYYAISWLWQLFKRLAINYKPPYTQANSLNGHTS